MIDQNELRRQFSYNSENGLFTRIALVKNSHAKIGDIANCKDSGSGYIRFNVNNKLYLAHRLAWLYVHGKFPDDKLDHINGIKHDNRICNLRESNNAENLRNVGRRSHNKSGFKGVSWKPHCRKWVAQCKTDGKVKYLGVFKTPELAHKAYAEHASKAHGEFFRP